MLPIMVLTVAVTCHRISSPRFVLQPKMQRMWAEDWLIEDGGYQFNKPRVQEGAWMVQGMRVRLISYLGTWTTIQDSSAYQRRPNRISIGVWRTIGFLNNLT